MKVVREVVAAMGEATYAWWLVPNQVIKPFKSLYNTMLLPGNPRKISAWTEDATMGSLRRGWACIGCHDI